MHVNYRRKNKSESRKSYRRLSSSFKPLNTAKRRMAEKLLMVNEKFDMLDLFENVSRRGEDRWVYD